MDFKKPALAMLPASPSPESTANLLYVLAAIAVEEKDWTTGLGHARRLVTEFPTHAAADDALAGGTGEPLEQGSLLRAR